MKSAIEMCTYVLFFKSFPVPIFKLFKKNKFIYLFVFLKIFGCVRSPLLCTRAFPSCSERGLLFVAVRMLLTAVASPVAEHGF